MSDPLSAEMRQQELLEVLVRVGLIAVMVVVCFRIFAPFMNLLLWGLILGVALYPLQQKIAGGPEGGQGRASTLLILGTILLIGTPTVMIASAFAGHIYDTFDAASSNQLKMFSMRSFHRRERRISRHCQYFRKSTMSCPRQLATYCRRSIRTRFPSTCSARH